MAVLSPQPKMQFTTAAGVPLSGGKVYTYIAGTTTPQATFTDNTGSTPNTNPVVLDSRGEANIWLGGALYKFRLTDANDVEIWTVDYISAPTSAVSPVLSGSVSIDSDTPSPALRITQTGTGPVLRVQDSADPDATPFIIDTGGNVGIGTALPAVRLAVSSSDAVLLPVGTTLQRPTGAAGYIRFNSSNNSFEGHNGSDWGTVVSTASTGVVTQGMLASGVAGNGPAFSAFQSSGQSISNSVFTKVVFQTKEFDTANCFDNASNFRFTPNVAGYYQISGTVNVGSVLAAGVGALIYKNGGAEKWGTWTAADTLQSNVSALIFMNGTTDFVELYTWVNANTTLGALSYSTYFQGFLARAA